MTWHSWIFYKNKLWWTLSRDTGRKTKRGNLKRTWMMALININLNFWDVTKRWNHHRVKARNSDKLVYQSRRTNLQQTLKTPNGGDKQHYSRLMHAGVHALNFKETNMAQKNQKQPLTPMKRRNTDQGFVFSPLTDADGVLQVQNDKRQMRRWVQISLHWSAAPRMTAVD